MPILRHFGRTLVVKKEKTESIKTAKNDKIKHVASSAYAQFNISKW
jgi:hypothetical protein